MARASSSLPVPDSPSSSTVAMDGAACMTISIVRRQGSDWPMMRLVPLGRQLRAQRAVLLHQRALLERLAHRAHHVGALDRLGDEVVGPLLHGLDRVLDGAVGGHQDGLGLGRDAPARLEQIDPRHARHHQIGQQHRDRLAPQDLQRLAAAAPRSARAATPSRRSWQRIDDARLVVHHQNRGQGLARGGCRLSILTNCVFAHVVKSRFGSG